MNILFIAPIPPPLNGQSLTAKVFLDHLDKNHNILLVDVAKDSHKDGANGIKRVLEIGKALWQVLLKQGKAEAIYLHNSESMAGNIRDLFIYLICFGKLSKLYIHLHGGSLKKWVFDKSPLLWKFNRFFLKRIGGVVVLGESHVHIFDGLVDCSKVHIVPNFAGDEFFITEDRLVDKYKNTTPLKVLYLSNLIEGKGYEFLAQSFEHLSDNTREQLELIFAGGFNSEKEKQAFLQKIAAHKQVKYVGFVSGKPKAELLSNAHVFCFPSYLNEGQPVSILEAYASGCCVITTGKSGIKDVFTENVNGYAFEERSSASISKVLESIVSNPEQLSHFGKRNLQSANSNFLTEIYNSTLEKIILNQSQ